MSTLDDQLTPLHRASWAYSF